MPSHPDYAAVGVEFARLTSPFVRDDVVYQGRLRVKIGVPKEIKTHEYRVGLTPGAVREYVAAGHDVLVEANAGAGIGVTDEDYRGAGATIAGSAREVLHRAA